MALLNKITIRIFSCTVLLIAGIINSSGFNNPGGIVLNPAGTRAYITNYGNSGTDANISHGTSNGASYSNLINDSETSLPITVSTLHITHNGHPLNK